MRGGGRMGFVMIRAPCGGMMAGFISWLLLEGWCGNVCRTCGGRDCVMFFEVVWFVSLSSMCVRDCGVTNVAIVVGA